MDWSQWLYGIALGLALMAGRPPVGLAIVMVLDLWGTIALAKAPGLVAYVDIGAAALLIGGNQREKIVSCLFAVMVFWETIASRLMMPNALIYTATDVLAFVQCGVIGGADRGVGRLYRSIRGRLAYPVDIVASGCDPGIAMARNPETHGR